MKRLDDMIFEKKELSIFSHILVRKIYLAPFLIYVSIRCNMPGRVFSRPWIEACDPTECQKIDKIYKATDKFFKNAGRAVALQVLEIKTLNKCIIVSKDF